MNLTKVPLNLLIGLLECSPISCICRNVMRYRSQSRKSLQLGLNTCIDLSATNPDHLGLISAYQVFADNFPNPSRPSNDYIDSTPSVCFTSLCFTSRCFTSL